METFSEQFSPKTFFSVYIEMITKTKTNKNELKMSARDGIQSELISFEEGNDDSESGRS